MKLLAIESTPLELAAHPTAKGYWTLTEDASAVFTVDKYIVTCRLRKGWVTDKRSGSRWIDKFIPKWTLTNSVFNWGIALHDASYSGWIPRDITDDMLLSNWETNTAVRTDFIAKAGYRAVRTVGWSGYYSLRESLPEPYTHNRAKEMVIYYKRNTQ
jgi:hypothetical protein